MSFLISLFVVLHMICWAVALGTWVASARTRVPNKGMAHAAAGALVFGIVLAGRETRTLPVAVYNMLSFEQVSWGPLAAAALVVTLPVLILTIIAQRQIVAGLTAGAVKGG